MDRKTVLIAGGTGFVGRAIVRRLASEVNVRVLTRHPDRARKTLAGLDNVAPIAGDVTDAATLGPALAGVEIVIDAAQFDGYPVEDPRRGMTFDRVDYGGIVNLIGAAKQTGAARIIYVSGAAADEASANPAFRAKGRAERALKESGLGYTIFRPSVMYGREDKVLNLIARALRFTPIFPVPGTGRQRMQPLLVGDLAQCVALAIAGRGAGGVYDIGGPDVMTFDDMVRLVMEITGRRRPIIHIPEAMLDRAGALGQMLPRPIFSRDAVGFLVHDALADNAPLLAEFAVRLTPAREGMSYLAA